ncbi:hypothetical protein DL237_06455 [Pseudooceanicola sediminis]|uniref:Transglycosylase SLT domain-containing protein n=1 Tax=Pseudooceanicola sediminis TaxID=2211117 RepID=A0A399J624_9RHOB|nr:hypothetical protein [Pseudooceanicola sediminis]KAA2317427.1 hypothetical protein E0K93_03830 [Puniceibacterium sp. HSS470]RII39779.1 hypothetical protein DL237_06455 [Pseudooceanicola sediminis]|tara:strand:+ start:4288 stop:5343 length:1056 start_codon:yes stop_codon:yes gene_type:complete
MLLRFRAIVRSRVIFLAGLAAMTAGPGAGAPVSLLAPRTDAAPAALSDAPRRAALLPQIGSIAPGLARADPPRADPPRVDSLAGSDAGTVAAAVARDLLRGAQVEPARPTSTRPTSNRPANKGPAPAAPQRPARATPTIPTGVIQTAATAPTTRHVSSLFSGRAATSLFAPSTRVRRPSGAEGGPAFTPLRSGSHAARLKHLIASVESHRDGYDAVQYAARVRPPKRPTQMTLAEIYDWIAATPGQQHAIGRYQIIPKTLRYLADSLGTDPRQIFSPVLQDRFADKLLQDAGYDAFLGNTLTRHGFMHNLAQVWAGLPTASGKSYYHGLAGNRAAMTWARFDAEMARIFPG